MANPSYLALTTMRGQILCNSQLAATTATTVYTVPAVSTAKIATAVVANASASPVTVSVSLHKAGDTADGTHRLVPSFSVPASGDPTSGGAVSLTDFLGGAMLAEGESVSVTAGTANAITVTLTGAVSS